MATWVDLCSVGEIPEGEGKSFEVKGKTIGVFQSQGQIRAIDDHCPHHPSTQYGNLTYDKIIPAQFNPCLI